MSRKINKEQPHTIFQSLECQGFCGAKTRTGKDCQALRVNGKKRCRMHGGAPGSGAPKGNKNAEKHGLYSREWLDATKTINELIRHIDKDGNLNPYMTRKDSLEEIITHGSFCEKVDNLMGYFAKGLISMAEFNRLLISAKKSDRA